MLVMPVAAIAAPDGAYLYSNNCAACHGSNGSGGVGVPLANSSFLKSVSERYIFQTIRKGRPGRVMPSYEQLSDAQVHAIVKHIRSWSSDEAPVYEQTPVSGNPENGAKLFKQHCASCHGANGEGGKGTGVTFSRPRDLPILAPALNNHGFLESASDLFIKKTLMNGREGTPMVSFLQHGLTEKDINDVVSYVRSFEKHQEKISTGKKEKQEPVLVYDSPYTFQETIDGIKRSITGANFRLIRIQKFEDGLVPKGSENEKKVIIYFCNFNMLNDALKIDPRAGLFLPCRVTVTEKDGKVQITSINPDSLSSLFNNDELHEICKGMSGLYRDIIEESIL